MSTPRITKLVLLLVILLTLTVLIVAAAQFRTKQLEREVGRFVVKSLVEERVAWANRGGHSPDGSIYVQYPSDSFGALGIPFEQIQSTPYLSAWKHNEPEPTPAMLTEIVAAINQEVYWISFAVQEISGDNALVDVIIDYPRYPRSGGTAAHWTLHFNGDEWEITEQDYYFDWD
ncbi:MAG: hypothetical protein KJ069_24210 [Anaerolineae bacterium]|nr:hypothetical protein [Anaerolineae bacterium]